MRALWIASSFHPQIGGIQRYTRCLIEALSPNHEPALVTDARQHPPPGMHVDHWSIPGLAQPQDVAEWERARARLASVIDRFEPDVVHLATAGLAVYRDVVPHGIPVIAHLHGKDLTQPWQTCPIEPVKAAIVRGLEGSDVRLAVSHCTVELAREAGVGEPIRVLYPAVSVADARADGGELRARFSLPSEALLLLTVSRITPRKGHRTVLDALAHGASNWHWVIVGDGRARADLEFAVASAGLHDRVTFIGWIDDDRTLGGLYAEADAFVLVPEIQRSEHGPDFESFGLCYLEAGVAGTPVIGSNEGGSREAILEGVTGLLIAPGSPSALLRALAELEAPSRRAALGAGGRRYAERLGGWERAAEAVDELYGRFRRRRIG
jgi:phosphatidyl-myo-inositol dimannoside synthase